MNKSLTYYLAGPMSNIPQFNFPLFDVAAVSLRDMGLTVISPHEQDSPAVQAEAWASPDGKLSNGSIAGETWAEILAKDVILIGDKVGGIIFLPNWQNSRGAKLEAFVGLLTGKKFAFFFPKGSWDVANDSLYQQDTLFTIDAEMVRNALRRFMP